MISQIAHAWLRASLVAILVVIPALLSPNIAPDTAQIVLIVAILAAFLTFMEYYGKFPSIVEFRFAAPYNRLRYIMVAICVLVLSMIARGKVDPSSVTIILSALGQNLAQLLDFPFSPVRILVLMLPAEAGQQLVSDVRVAAAVSYTLSMLLVAAFVVLIKWLRWPMRNGSFNVWINLPLFDPTRGGDVVERLRRDAGVNIVLGILLPFIVPTAVKAMSASIDTLALNGSQTLIWLITAWAFLPASMLVRGLALLRVAELIEAKRRRARRQEAPDGFQEA